MTSKNKQFPGPKRTPPKRVIQKKDVSDHALVRYLERVVGLDVEAFRLTMLTEEQKLMAKALQDCDIPLGGGVTAVVRSGIVVTIY